MPRIGYRYPRGTGRASRSRMWVLMPSVSCYHMHGFIQARFANSECWVSKEGFFDSWKEVRTMIKVCILASCCHLPMCILFKLAGNLQARCVSSQACPRQGGLQILLERGGHLTQKPAVEAGKKNERGRARTSSCGWNREPATNGLKGQHPKFAFNDQEPALFD